MFLQIGIEQRTLGIKNQQTSAKVREHFIDVIVVIVVFANLTNQSQPLTGASSQFEYFHFSFNYIRIADYSM